MAEQGHRVFVYGTLLRPERRAAILGYTCAVATASLAGYKICLGQWPYIIADDGGQAAGAVMLGLSDEDLVRLDTYEEISSSSSRGLYERCWLDVSLENGHTVGAWVYMPLLENWNILWREGQM